MPYDVEGTGLHTYDLESKVKVKAQTMYFIVNASPP